jgi:hypothetical protein
LKQTRRIRGSAASQARCYQPFDLRSIPCAVRFPPKRAERDSLGAEVCCTARSNRIPDSLQLSGNLTCEHFDVSRAEHGPFCHRTAESVLDCEARDKKHFAVINEPFYWQLELLTILKVVGYSPFLADLQPGPSANKSSVANAKTIAPRHAANKPKLIARSDWLSIRMMSLTYRN